MSDEPNPSSHHPLIAIAGACGGATCGVVAISFVLMHNFSDCGIWAIAFIAAAPCAMGLGMAYFMTKQSSQDSGGNK